MALFQKGLGNLFSFLSGRDFPQKRQGIVAGAGLEKDVPEGFLGENEVQRSGDVLLRGFIGMRILDKNKGSFPLGGLEGVLHRGDGRGKFGAKNRPLEMGRNGGNIGIRVKQFLKNERSDQNNRNRL